MQWGMIPRFHRAVCDLRPVGKSLGLKSGKAQNERMFFRLAHARTTLAEAPRRWGKNVARFFSSKMKVPPARWSAVVSLAPKMRLCLNVRRKRLLVSPFGKKFCDINERHNPF